MSRTTVVILLTAAVTACTTTTTDTSSSSSSGGTASSSSSGTVASSSSAAGSTSMNASTSRASSTSAGTSTSGASAASSLAMGSSSAATSGAGSSSAPSSGGGSSGGGATCGAGSFDSYWDNACGQGQDTVVSCQPASGSCQATGHVCGCGGQTYESECAAHAAGVDVDDRGGCPAPVDKFRCGSRFCNVGQYCIHTGDITGIPDNFVCVNLPGACNGTADCNCVRFAQCGEESMFGPTGTCVTVPGGVINRCPDARFY